MKELIRKLRRYLVSAFGHCLPDVRLRGFSAYSAAVLGALLWLGQSPAGAASIASLELGTTVLSDNTTGSATFTSKDPNLDSLPALSLTSGQQAQPGGAGYVSSMNWNVSGDPTRYWQFTLIASSGYQISVAEITIKGSRSSSGPTHCSLRCDADAYSADLAQAGSIGTSSSAISFTGLTLANKRHLTFRVYGWGAGVAGGSWKIGDGNDGSLDIDVQGTVTLATEVAPRYRSRQSGDWEDYHTWECSGDGGNTWADATADQTPTSGEEAVTIQDGHKVTATTSLTVEQVAVAPAGILVVASGQVLTVADGSGTDLDVSGTLTVNGTMDIQGQVVMETGSVGTVANGAVLKNEGTVTSALNTLTVAAGGRYQHNQDGGTIPWATWADGSTCEVVGWGGGRTAPAGLGQSFHHFTWNSASQPGSVQLAGGLLTVNGNLTIVSTGSGSVVLANNPSSTITMNIGGDLIIQGGTLDYRTGGSGGILAINLGGNFNQTGGTLTVSYSSASPQQLNFTGGDTSVSFAHPGGSLTLRRINTSIDTGKTLTLNNNLNTGDISTRTFIVKGALLCGSSILSGSAQFFLNTGATLGIGDPSGITSGTAYSGNIQTLSGDRKFDTGASYIYNGAAGAQVTGNGLPATVSGLSISNPNGVSLTRAVAVSGTLTFTSGRLKTGQYTLSLGTAAGVSGAGSGTGWVVGNLAKNFGVGQGQSFTFDLGDDAISSYTPAALANLGVGAAGTLTATVQGDTEPNLATSGISTTRYAARYWTITPGGGFALGGQNPTYALTVTFLANDLQNSADPTRFILRTDAGGAWAAPTDGTAALTTTTGSGFSSFGSFAVGEPYRYACGHGQERRFHDGLRRPARHDPRRPCRPGAVGCDLVGQCCSGGRRGEPRNAQRESFCNDDLHSDICLRRRRR